MGCEKSGTYRVVSGSCTMVRVAQSYPEASTKDRTAATVSPVALQSSTTNTRRPSGRGPIQATAPALRSYAAINSGSANPQDTIVPGTNPPRAMATTASGRHSSTRPSSEETIRSA